VSTREAATVSVFAALGTVAAFGMLLVAMLRMDRVR
jgi:hypothetical protein